MPLSRLLIRDRTRHDDWTNVFARERQRSLRRAPAGMTPQAIMLIIGTVVLLLVSGGIVIWGTRGSTAPPPLTSPNISGGVAATVPPLTPTTTPAPTSGATQVATPATRPAPTGAATAATVATTRPATATRATVATTRAVASATPDRPLVANGPCTLALPSGFVEERPGGGYYPASDQTGFAALDQFATEGSSRTAESLAQGFINVNLTKVLQNVRQTGAEQTDDGYRLDFTASVGGQPGRGSVYVRRFGTVACGATLYLLDRSTIPFATTREVLILSLQTR